MSKDKISGKQIKDNSIKQQQVGVEDATKPDHVVKKDYVDQLVNNKSSLDNSAYKNIDMSANQTDFNNGYQLALNIPILEDTLADTRVIVYLNGIKMKTGSDRELFFSPDGGTTKRLSNSVRIGDLLYWNSDLAGYELEPSDNVDFVYLTNNNQTKVANLNTDSIAEFETDDDIVLLEFTGDNGDESTIIIDGNSYTVGQVSGNFVFDKGSSNEFTFNNLHDYTEITINGNDYVIRYTGENSKIFYTYKKKEGDSNNLFGPIMSNNLALTEEEAGHTNYAEDEPIYSLNGDMLYVQTQYTYNIYKLEFDNEITLTRLYRSYQQPEDAPGQDFGNDSSRWGVIYNDKLVILLKRESNDRYVQYFKVDEDGLLTTELPNIISNVGIVDGYTYGISVDIDDDQLVAGNIILNYDYDNDIWSDVVTLNDTITINSNVYHLNNNIGVKIEKNNRVVYAVEGSSSDDKIIEYTWDSNNTTYNNQTEISLPSGETTIIDLVNLKLDKFLIITDNLNIYVYDYDQSNWVISQLSLPYYLNANKIVEQYGFSNDSVSVNYDHFTDKIYVIFIINDFENYYGVRDSIITYQNINGSYQLIEEFRDNILQVDIEDEGVTTHNLGSKPFIKVNNNVIITPRYLNSNFSLNSKFSLFYNNNDLTDEKYPLTKSGIPYVFRSVINENITDELNLTYDFFNLSKEEEGNSEISIKYKSAIRDNYQISNVNTHNFDKNQFQDMYVKPTVKPKTNNNIIGEETLLKQYLISENDNDKFAPNHSSNKFGSFPTLTLTINSGSINGVGPGVYNLSPLIYQEYGTYSTYYEMAFNLTTLTTTTSSLFLFMLSKTTSYYFHLMSINGSSVTYSSKSGTTLNSIRLKDTTSVFKNYTTANADFNIDIGVGW